MAQKEMHSIPLLPQTCKATAVISPNGLTFGPRLGFKYFWTSGSGFSGSGTNSLPYETGSYDAALCECLIGNANITSYSSVFPTNATEYDRSLYQNTWGEVLEVILASTNNSVSYGGKEIKLASGLLQSRVYKNNIYLGSFACEYSSDSSQGGNPSQNDFQTVTFQDIYEMIERRYGEITQSESSMAMNKLMYTVTGGYSFEPYKRIYKEMTVPLPKIVGGTNHGTALAGIVFTEWQYPIAT